MTKIVEATIGVPGAELHLEKRGVKPEAVFVHGVDGDLHTWDGVWTALDEDFAALRYDLRDFGRSKSSSDEPFDHAEDLLALLDAVEISQCDLIGGSMGGSIALNFALEHPERVRSLVLISPGIVAWEWSEEWRTLWAPIAKSARKGDLEQARLLWWRHPLFETTRCSPAAPALHDSIMRSSGAQWIEDKHRQMMPDVERLHMLKPRTLLLTGGQDLQDFRLIADLIEAGAPNVRRIDLPEAGHMLSLEYPERCAHEIAAFLRP